MAQSIVALNISNIIVHPLNSLNFRANSLSSSLPIIRSKWKNPQFSVQCANGVFPSIIEGVEKWFSGFTKLFKPRKKFKTSYDFWDFMTYLEISRQNASQFAVDEFNRRKNKALRLDRILKTEYKDNVDTLYAFELEATDEDGRRSVYNAVVLCPFQGKNELLEFSEVEQ